jgi:O-antigen ligase
MELHHNLHRWLLLVLLLGNAIAFAGVDPVTRLATAALVVVLVLDLRRPPEIPRLFPQVGLGFAVLAAIQLVPLPFALRRLLQPGLREVMAAGLAPLSVAPWATLVTVAGMVILLALAVTAARMASTRSGLPTLLTLLAVTGVLLAVLGFLGESSGPAEVLLMRPTTVGGSPYGPYVNKNHFAVGLELTLPAALVLAAAAVRNAIEPGPTRQRAVVILLLTGSAAILMVTALLRSHSRGGIVFTAAALAVTLPWWRRQRKSRRWPALVALALLVVVAGSLAVTRLGDLENSFKDLFVVEGIEGNTRWDLWQATMDLIERSPIVGSGLGSYRYAIGLDKPATGVAQLGQAHNDWLEWTAETGILGLAVLALGIAALVQLLRPSQTRKRRFEYRYAAAGAVFALAAAALHEGIGFGLQTPLNAYLLALWIGLVWGISVRSSNARSRQTSQADDAKAGSPEEQDTGELAVVGVDEA